MSSRFDELLREIQANENVERLWNSLEVIPRIDSFSSVKDLAENFFDSGLKSLKESSYLYRNFRCETKLCLGFILFENAFLSPEFPEYFPRIIERLVERMSFFKNISIFLQLVKLLVGLKKTNQSEKASKRIVELFNRIEEFHEGLMVFLDAFISLYSDKPPGQQAEQLLSIMNQTLGFAVSSAFFGNRNFIFIHTKGENFEITCKFNELEGHHQILLYSIGYSKAFFSDSEQRGKKKSVPLLKSLRNSQIAAEVDSKIRPKLFQSMTFSQVNEASNIKNGDTGNLRRLLEDSNPYQKMRRAETLGEANYRNSDWTTKNGGTGILGEYLKHSEVAPMRVPPIEEKPIRGSGLNQISHRQETPPEILGQPKRENSNNFSPSGGIQSQMSLRNESPAVNLNKKSSFPNLEGESPVLQQRISLLSGQDNEPSTHKSRMSDALNRSQVSEFDVSNVLERKNNLSSQKLKKSEIQVIPEVVRECDNWDCKRCSENTRVYVNEECGHAVCFDCLQSLLKKRQSQIGCLRSYCFSVLDPKKINSFLNFKAEEEEKKEILKKSNPPKNHNYLEECENLSCQNKSPKGFMLSEKCNHQLCEECARSVMEKGGACPINQCFTCWDRNQIHAFLKERSLLTSRHKGLRDSNTSRHKGLRDSNKGQLNSSISMKNNNWLTESSKSKNSHHSSDKDQEV